MLTETASLIVGFCVGYVACLISLGLLAFFLVYSLITKQRDGLTKDLADVIDNAKEKIHSATSGRVS